MRGEGPGFPLQRHQHLLPRAAESRERGRAAACQAPSCSVMPPQAQNVCFVSGPQWQRGVPAGPTGMALHGFFSCISIPCQLGPRASLAWGALAHPISPLGFSVGTDHMKDVDPQTRTDAIPQQSGTGARLCPPIPPSGCGTSPPPQAGTGAAGIPWDLTHFCASPAPPPLDKQLSSMLRGEPWAAAPRQGIPQQAQGQPATTKLWGGVVEPPRPGGTSSPMLTHSRAAMRGELGPTPARGEASRDV